MINTEVGTGDTMRMRSITFDHLAKFELKIVVLDFITELNKLR